MESRHTNEQEHERSRVSSSNSSLHNNSYQLMPREEAISIPRRDVPSPRVSFPFKRVQTGLESSMHSRSHNESRGSALNGSRAQNESNQLIEAIGDLQHSRNNDNRIGQGEHVIAGPISHEECVARARQLQEKIGELEELIRVEKEYFESQRKANQIFMDNFGKVKAILQNNGCHFEGEGITQIADQLYVLLRKKEEQHQQQLKQQEKLFQEQHQNHDLYSIVEQQQQKIRDLREQLLKSSQNNINAIFNTEITEAHCLHLQIKKMNGEIVTLKENLLRVTSENSQNIHNLQKQKVVNVFHHNKTNSLDSSDDQDIHTELKLTRRRRSKRHNRRDSSSSDKYNSRSKMLASTQMKVGELVEGYKVLRDQYKRLESTLGQLHENHTDNRHLFQSLRMEINKSLEHQLEVVKQTMKRPSSSHAEVKVAMDIQSKLNHLVNTLNAPERVNAEQNMGDDQVSQWKSVEFYRKILDLQSHNNHLEHEVSHLETENQNLKRRLWIQQRNQNHHNHTSRILVNDSGNRGPLHQNSHIEIRNNHQNLHNHTSNSAFPRQIQTRINNEVVQGHNPADINFRHQTVTYSSSYVSHQSQLSPQEQLVTE